MIGRNDPCLCGSGKKYKKCCMNKHAITTDEVVKEEIELLLQSFYNAYPERPDLPPYIELVNGWKEQIQERFMTELIEAIALDEYFFDVAPTIWENYIEKQRQKVLRPKLQQLLNDWTKPARFVGKVVETAEHKMIAEHFKTGEHVTIALDTERPIPLHSNFYTFLLPNGEENNEQLAVSTLIFIPTDFDEALAKWEMPERWDASTTLQFFLHLIEAGFTGDEWTNFEANVLTKTIQFLNEQKIEAPQFVTIVEDYLAAKQPNARKDVAIAAGAIRFGVEQQLLDYETTWTELGAHFDVSPSSLAKYAKEIEQFYAKSQ